MAVYQSALKLLYVDKLLERVRDVFSKHYTPKKYDYVAFEAAFKRELAKAEQKVELRPKQPQQQQGNLTQRKVCNLGQRGTAFTPWEEWPFQCISHFLLSHNSQTDVVPRVSVSRLQPVTVIYLVDKGVGSRMTESGSKWVVGRATEDRDSQWQPQLTTGQLRRERGGGKG